MRKALTIAAIAALAVTIALPSTPARADDIRKSMWHLGYLKIAQANAISTGKGVTVGVIDTGVVPHPDLRRNLLPGHDVVSGGDSTGRIDTDGHGTEMAGLIAGHGRSGEAGVVGIAPEAKILPVKESNAEDNGNSATIAKGIDWLSSQDVQVINISSAAGPSLALEDAVQKALASDQVIVAGSGNRPRMVTFGNPASLDGVLAVGAIDKSGKHAAISMKGSPVQICAPGMDITSTEPKDRYATFDGTSPATAIVSGAAALVRAKFPDLSAPQVIERLTSTATDIGPSGRDDECGFGVLNIVKALTADAPATGQASDAPSAAPTAGTGQSSPEPDSDGVSVGAIAAVVGGGVVILGGLVALLAARRRRAR